MTRFKEARLALPDGSFSAVKIIFDQKILDIIPLHNTTPATSLQLPIVLPGFVDLHIHGAAGFDVMDAKQAVEKIALSVAQTGTTSFLATTMTAPFEQLESAFLAMKNFYENPKKNHARLLGVHLEGPFIGADKLGAQPNFTRPGTLEEVLHLHQIVPIRVVTLAPEVAEHQHLIKELSKHDIVVQIGHSNASYEQAQQALINGAQSFTHLYNAMSALHHRAPGVVGAALAHAQYSECIPDLQHVHPGAIKAALRAIPKLYFVTDATSATAMPDGQYQLGAQRVHKCSSGVRLSDGTLAGSCLTMNQALKNLHSLELNLFESSLRLSTYAADLISQNQLGRLEKGALADLLFLNDQLEIQEVIINGESCE